MNNQESIAAYMENGELYYIAKEGTTKNIEDAMLFENWEKAQNEIFVRGYNKLDTSGWYVFTQYDGKWRRRMHVGHDDWWSKFYEEHK